MECTPWGSVPTRPGGIPPSDTEQPPTETDLHGLVVLVPVVAQGEAGGVVELSPLARACLSENRRESAGTG